MFTLLPLTVGILKRLEMHCKVGYGEEYPLSSDEEVWENLSPAALVSPAMGHWGTYLRLTSNNLIFFS